MISFSVSCSVRRSKRKRSKPSSIISKKDPLLLHCCIFYYDTRRELYRSASANRFFTVTPAIAEILYVHKKNDDVINPNEGDGDDDNDDEDDSHKSKASRSLTLTQKVINAVLIHVGMYRRSWASACILTRRLTGLLLMLVLAYLSQPVVMNILSPRQAS